MATDDDQRDQDVTDSIFDGEDHKVDARAVTAERLVGLISTGVSALLALVPLSIAWALGGVPSWLYGWLLPAVLVLFGALFSVVYKWPEVQHRYLSYRVDDMGVRINRGVVWRKIISIPASRVQHTDVSQGPVERNFGLATLTVYTAGTEGASIALSGLSHQVALQLRDHLLPRDDA